MAVAPLEGPIKVLFQVEHGGLIRIFEWDPEKNWSNSEKHGIRFEDAAIAFMTDYVRSPDQEHEDELRRAIYGMAPMLTSDTEAIERSETADPEAAEKAETADEEATQKVTMALAFIAYTERDGRIRIISARPTSQKEKRYYHEKIT